MSTENHPPSDPWSILIDGDDPEFEDKQKALVIKFLVKNLIDRGTLADKHAKTEIFLDLCRLSVEALDRHPESMHLTPAAPFLLGYLRKAMARYIEAANTAESNSPKAWKTAARNSALAKALYLGDENATGGRPKSEGHDNFAIKVLYAKAFYEMPNVNTMKPTPAQVTAATRQVYEELSGNPWEQDNPSADKEMARIRRVLKTSGYHLPPPNRSKR